MAIYAATKERSAEEIRRTLAALVDSFETDPTGNRRLIRDLLDNDRESFYSSAIQILKVGTDSRGAQYLVALLVAQGLLLQAICDPALSRDQALSLCRSAVRVDPSCDAALARGLADSETGQGTVFVRDALRLMEVLCEVGDPSRMMASMMRLLRHPNSYLRSKAVKIVGRGSKSPKWVRARLNEPDARIRANAIESLWSVDTAEARGILYFAAHEDGNNRVMANALLGLYYLGDCGSLGALVKMANDESPLLRASAAWVMGETGDSRFQECLRKLLNDPDPATRKRAFSAIGRVKANPLQRSAVLWHVAARVSRCDLKGRRRAVVAVASDDGREIHPVPSLGFVLTENTSPVLDYKVTERPAPGAISVVFLVPRACQAAAPFREAVETCLKWKRTSDLWCILPYIESSDGPVLDPAGDPTPLPFQASAETLRESLDEPARRLESSDLWNSVWRSIKLDSGAPRGPRHLFICSSAAEARLAGHGLTARAKTPRIQIHSFSTAANSRLQDFCREVGAPFTRTDPGDIGDSIRRAYLSLLARYEIHYAPAVAGALQLKIRVQAPGGMGEAIAPYEIDPPGAA